MLLRLDSALPGGIFTEMKKLADAKPEFSELPVLGERNVFLLYWRHVHFYRITI